MLHILKLGDGGDISKLYGPGRKIETSLLFRNSYTKWLSDITYHDLEIIYHEDQRNQLHDLFLSNNVSAKRTFSRPFGIITDSLVYKITKRIEFATGLLVEGKLASENYQIVNYVPGGLYRTHNDAVGIDDIVSNRLVTFMLSVSSPYFGGATSFPLLGVKCDSTPKSAIFWTNLHNDGTFNPMSAHAGCPTAVGLKWISNKWIQYNENFKTVPCRIDDHNR